MRLSWIVILVIFFSAHGKGAPQERPCTCSVILKGSGQTSDNAGHCYESSAGATPDNTTIGRLQDKDVWYPAFDQPNEPWYSCQFN